MRIFYLFLLLLWVNLAQAQLGTVTQVTLEFTPSSGSAVVVTATDAGNGFVADGPISLMESSDYTLAVKLANGSTDVTGNVVAEDYLFYYGFGEELFELPNGNGNVDNRADPVNYSDQDSNNLPVGLSTSWKTACTGEGDQTGSFRVVLKHQPSAKTATSSVSDGTTNFDISWNLTVVDDADAPECENEEEVIDRVTLTFTPTAGGDPVVAVASDPDGPGPQDLTVQPISLMESTAYQLSISLENTAEGENITEEIQEEDDEHQFFFAFGEELFELPNGDGNIDNPADPVNYNDQDDNGLPVGLSTNWTTACTSEGNVMSNFRVVLKHQPGVKTATSGFNDGGTDIDITWMMTVVDDADAPECENEEEVIDRVTLTFTPTAGGDPVVAIASDPDGPGPQSLTVEPISLMESTEYQLSIGLENTAEGENITEEIEEEDDEHQFFFAFGEELFELPNGDGNIDNPADPVNYNDQDDNGLPVGLSTNWTTACTGEGNVMGDFRVVLKHQPGVKTATSGFTDGGTDIDITWMMTVVDDADAPECENEEEVIDRVTLTFTPTAGGEPVVAVASDPDGPGPQSLTVEPISLMESTEYQLSIGLENTAEGENITEEIQEEDDEHQFFFAFGEDLFELPNGDGNIDNPADPINYNDQDDNGLPVGLSTNWTTACTSEGSVMGDFRVVLKHQPGVKTATSSFNDGGTDIDITWNMTVVDDADAPECENEEEIIDRVTLTFTPTAGGDPVVAIASDPDGPGPQSLTVEPISLMESTEYQLSIGLENTAEGENITEEILEEDDEHQFFFAFGEDLFELPNGDGNIDNPADPINYNDQDDNGLPVGLSTNWTTACTSEGNVTADFRVVLKHQPGVKTATSSFNDGGTDIDITWNMTIVDDADAPECENEEEIIDKVTLTFTPVGGGTVISAVALDADGPGPQSLTVEDISLAQNKTYELSIALENTIEGENITEEILEEDDEHQFFFAWTGDIFTDPMGDGNIDNPADPINYNDQDGNGLPLGLSTNWTVSAEGSAGTFRVVLKHQPGVKTATSSFNDGGTDIDITWNVNAILTSTDNLNGDQKLVIAPNPVQDELRLLTENIDLRDSRVIIYNALGMVVKSIKTSENVLPIQDLGTGQYILEIRGDSWNAVRRFVKIK
ncbi:MAG: T9SS type A sorting domain-containing protein [Bacteroidota bacterium]